MKDLLQDSVYFGVFISLGAYAIGMFLRRKTGYSFLNPLLVSIILVIAVLLLTGGSYEKYNAQAICSLRPPSALQFHCISRWNS